MKHFFLWLMLLLSLFNNVCYSADENALSDSNRISNIITGIVEDNKANINKNASEINKIKSNYNNIKLRIKKNADNSRASINSFHGELTTLDKQLNENKNSIRRINSKILSAEETANNNTNTIFKTTESIQTNTSRIVANEKSISDYSDISSLELEKLNKTLSKLNVTYGLTSDYLDRFWVLIAGVLVFFMQAGFKTFEAGMVRKTHDDNVAIKNILDWLVISLIYFAFGFGLMFGDSYNGLFGTTLFGPTTASLENVKNSIEGQYLGLEFFIYQLAFAATAATIVSGAMSERIALIPYITLSVFIGAVVYPLFGHWAWGGTFYLSDQGWLYALGFRDFAGSTVVHSIGAWVALAGVIEIGPRIGRYDADGKVNSKDFIPANLGYSTLGVLILWFGWWGFNGGSQLKYDESIASIVINTIISGSAAGLTAFFHALSKSRDKYEIFPKLLGGILGGLVAITACCNSVSTHEALIIGLIAGLVHNYSFDFLMQKLKLDDPVGAIAVHGFCGVWGTMCVAFFGELDSDFFVQNNSLFYSEHALLGFLENSNIRIQQSIIQFIGVITAFVFTFSLSSVFFKFIRRIPGIGLRVLPADEKRGSILGISN